MNLNWLKGYIWCLEKFLDFSETNIYFTPENKTVYSDFNYYLAQFVYRELKTKEAYEERLKSLLQEAYGELERRTK